MKNDVVRWNAATATTTNAPTEEGASTRSGATSTVTAAPAAGAPATTAGATSGATITKTTTPTTANSRLWFVDCDNTPENCSFLVEKREKSKGQRLSRSSWQQQQDHHHHQRQQRQQRQQLSQQSRTFLRKFLLNCLQFSAFVILCNSRIGLVAAAQLPSTTTATTTTTTITRASVPASVSVPVSIQSNDEPLPALPYELAVDEVADGAPVASGHYTHTWAVHIPNGDSGLANEVAHDHGFINLGKIFDDHYHFAHHTVSKRSLTPASYHQTRLDDDHRVHWAKQQTAKSRRKRDFIRMRPSRTSSRAFSLVDVVPFSDPKWAQMWYLNRGGGLDMNVIPAWQEGITGKGIVVTILDDGLESDHPDIEHNYDPKASYDVNSHDDDPMPHYDMTDSNRHGTRCAGEVAATANNSICAVGIAFGASVGGVRMLDGDVTDAVEARSLSLNPQHIDIYSASWGPDDDGKTVDGPGELASRAFIEGVTKGRSGKGSIFIWASGNGGRELDNCNCDGYTNSIWTLSISSATEEGHVPWYSEKCSSTLATTYSSGGQSEKQVVTTDLHHSCTVSHTGTSASAPLAAGIAALVLESNQNLTWRDLQHIVVRTAKPANLQDPTWTKNGVGRRISHSFGYGLMDAAAMVRLARTWKTVPEQQRCEINAPHVDKVIPPRSYITLQLTVKHCLALNFLEHVQAKITLTSQRRGDIQLYLKSPAGTKVTLLTSRIHDVSRSGFNQWPFMSVHTWGESPHGNWQLEIHNEGRFMAQITQWELIFYGTEAPAQPDDNPKRLNPDQLSPFGNDMEHNDIEYDANGSWQNMQQVGESSVLTNDKTGSACIKATIDQRCLACAPPTYHYAGRCFVQCPAHSYPMAASNTTAEELDGNTVAATPLPNNELNDILLPMDRRRRSLAAVDGASSQPRSCGACDSTCQRCYGPLSTQCSTCYPGSQLRRVDNETSCLFFNERSSGVETGDSANAAAAASSKASKYALRSNVAVVLMVVASAVIVLSLMALISSRRRWLADGSAGGAAKTVVAYDRLSLLQDDTDDALEPTLHLHLGQSSDDDDDDDDNDGDRDADADADVDYDSEINLFDRSCPA